MSAREIADPLSDCHEVHRSSYLGRGTRVRIKSSSHWEMMSVLDRQRELTFGCQVFYSHVRSSSDALLAITELPNNELTGIHTLSLPPLLL